MRPAPCPRSPVRLALTALALAPVSCRAVVDSGDYAPCPRSHYSEDFTPPTTLKTLYEQCWNVSGADADPTEQLEPTDTFTDDGDLIIRVRRPDNGGKEHWRGTEQGPFVYQTLEDSFLLITRVEILNQSSGDLCVKEGNSAGLVARTVGADPGWVTFFLQPFSPRPPGTFCNDEEGDPIPTWVQVRSRDDSLELSELNGVLGVGADGEADLALCGLSGQLFFFVRDPASTTDAPAWIQLGGSEIPGYELGSTPIEVGLSAAGRDPNFQAEGHFTWTYLTEGLLGDGCRRALDEATLPELE